MTMPDNEILRIAAKHLEMGDLLRSMRTGHIYGEVQVIPFARALLSASKPTAAQSGRRIRWGKSDYERLLDALLRAQIHGFSGEHMDRARNMLGCCPDVCPEAPAQSGEPVAWKEYAEHLECCAQCSEMSYEHCNEGGRLHDAANVAPTEKVTADAGSMDESGVLAWEVYLDEQKRILGMPGLLARPCFLAGYRAALARSAVEQTASDAADVRASVLEEAAQVCDEYGDLTAAEKDSALLVGKVDLSNAMSGEPRAATFLAVAIRALKAKS